MDIATLRDVLVGPLAALITPMKADGDLDLDAFGVHVDFHVRHRVTALIVNGTIGEAPSLTPDEREQTAEAVVRAADGRTRTIISVGHDCWPTTMRLAEHAAAIGADALLVSLPQVFKLDGEAQREFWARFADAVSLPFIVYCSAHSATPRPSVDSLTEVAALPGFLAVKDPSPSISRIRELVDGLGPEVPVIAAGEKTLPEAAPAGAVAAMTASVCFAPGRVRAILDASAAGRLEDAQALFEPIAHFRSLFQASMDQGYPSFVPYTKAACDAVGLPAGPPRLPLSPLTPDQYEQVADRVRDGLDENA